MSNPTDMQDKYCGHCYEFHPIQSQHIQRWRPAAATTKEVPRRSAAPHLSWLPLLSCHKYCSAQDSQSPGNFLGIPWDVQTALSTTNQPILLMSALPGHVQRAPPDISKDLPRRASPEHSVAGQQLQTLEAVLS